MTIHKDTGRRLGRMIGEMDTMILALGTMIREWDPAEGNEGLRQLRALQEDVQHLKENTEIVVDWMNQRLRGGG